MRVKGRDQGSVDQVVLGLEMLEDKSPADTGGLGYFMSPGSGKSFFGKERQCRIDNLGSSIFAAKSFSLFDPLLA